MEFFIFPITPSTFPTYSFLESTITEPSAGHEPEYDSNSPPSWLTLSTLPENITNPHFKVQSLRIMRAADIITIIEAMNPMEGSPSSASVSESSVISASGW